MPDITVRITRQENASYYNCDIGDTIGIDFERYIACVTAGEIGNSPAEACKAQAVAARSLAISRGALRGLVISDDASVMQAFRANRYDEEKYPNALRAAEETRGIVLIYNGSIAVAHYSANNGGKTTSSEERWGTAYPYLIAQKDPWDAEDGTAKYGHGVGMSQKGAIIAAKKGFSYQEILSFYYPGCELKDGYANLVQKEVVHVTDHVLLNDIAEAIVMLAESKLGDPYVYGTRGHNCTPTVRKQYASYHPEYQSNIYNACPVLSRKQNSCDGCKWQGHLCYDCRGFTWYVLKNAMGLDLDGGGATSQYNSGKNWDRKGKIGDMPNVVCCVFKNKDDKMSHTGLHIGDGIIIHCSTTVKKGATSDTTWTHYAIPKGLYNEKELAEAGKVIMMKTVRNGSSGDAVVQLQQWLKELGYDAGEADGKFGSRTDAAVKKFQQDHGLTADGIVGTLTWNALEEALKVNNDESDGSNADDAKEKKPNAAIQDIWDCLSMMSQYIETIGVRLKSLE